MVPEPGGPGGPLAPPIFGRSVNPIQTGEGRLSPPITTGTPNVFHLPAPLHVISTLWGSTSTYRRYFDDAGFAFISAKNLEGWNKFPPDSDGPVRDLRKYLGTKKGLFYIHEQALITTLLSRDQVTKIMYV